MNKKLIPLVILFFAVCLSLFGQTHISVPLGHPVYTVLEQAQMRGLIGYLPNVRPYSSAFILEQIEEILDNDNERRFGGLNDAERRILEQFLQDLNPPRDGFDLMRGTYSIEHTWNDVYFSGEVGFAFELNLAGGVYPIAGGYRYSPEDDELFSGARHPEAGDLFIDHSFIPSVHFAGDLGRSASYRLALSIWSGRSPRAKLGMYQNVVEDDGDLDPRLMPSYSEPLAYFPYTYTKRWDGYVFNSGGFTTGGMLAWPVDGFNLAYSMLPELAGTLLNGHVFYRFSRHDREWAGMTTNGSLVLNQSAQPFLAIETVIRPFTWMAFSSLTGVLEYHNATHDTNRARIDESSGVFQNAFSINMLELNYKNYVQVGFGSSAVWSKRFELGYLFPFADNFIYQTSIGDFDNMALFFNIQGQYPGIGKLWLSLFIDEMSPSSDFMELSRMMYAYQVGVSVNIPWLPFSSVTLSYTKNEPYNYTHIRVDTPWNTSPWMETNYVNFGKSLGHYIPPNADELLIRFETIPFPQSMFSVQYQMIRHGADYGDRAVAGSSLWSELLKYGRGSNPRTRKYFLEDGAYQWMHILRLRGEYSLTSFNVPVRIFCEVGGVFSYFTDIDNNIEPNSGFPSSYRIINTPQYPHSLSFIGVLGIQIFPKF